MIIVKGGVTTPKGFSASGLASGIKSSGKRDLGLLYSKGPAIAAAAFTTNRFQAAPIRVSRLNLRNKTHQAIIVNSGNANCANGKAGDRDAFIMVNLAAGALGLKDKEVLVASTGIIGKRLPVEKIRKHMPDLLEGLSERSGSFFSEAILTTDTVKKESAVKLRTDNCAVTIGGTAKGAGMIYPNLKTERHATMLAFLTTDIAINKKMLKNALQEALEVSFNMISVDGDMSTNDSCFILANGLARNNRIETKNRQYHIFTDALKFIMKELAKRIVEDGEGATKFVEIEVVGAKKKADAVLMARRASTSNLLKTCVYGEDPNWGRIASACGASGVDFDPGKIDIYLGDVKVMSKGMGCINYNRDKTKALFKKKRICIKVDLNSGAFKAAAWTCDLSKKYVEINAEYST